MCHDLRGLRRQVVFLKENRGFYVDVAKFAASYAAYPLALSNVLRSRARC